MSVFVELKRRNVFRVGIAYAITSWALLQVIDVVAPILELPDWAPKLVLVLLGIGLFPALIFAWAFELTPEGLKREKDVERSESITAATGRKLDRIIIGVLSVAIVLLLVERYTNDEPASRSAELGRSIAVLPFVNMSSDPEQEYFSDGITEEILNSLAAVRELKVAGRTSSFAFKGQNDDLRRIGETLGVENILEGSVRKSGQTVRITAQLIQVDDGFHLWSETYDRKLTDVFEIQEEIATEILAQLRATLLEEEAEALAPQATSPEVYDRYLLARQRLYNRSRAAIESAVEILDEAIALDPGYAPALAQRGIATLFLSDRSYGSIPEAEAQRQGKRYVDQALEIDPQLAEAWAGLGLYYTNRQSEHEAAIEALTKALDLNPNLIDASNWLYVVLSGIGENVAARDLIEHMIDKDPLYKPAFGNGVQTFNNFGMREKAEAAISRFRSFDPNDPIGFYSEGLHHFYNGEVAAGFPLAERGIELAPSSNVAGFTWSVALIQSLQIERLAEEGNDFFRIDSLDALGRRDEAFELAYKLEQDGYIEELFRLLNRAGQSRELTDYVEERWPTLEAFAADYPKDGSGYSTMAEIALAYQRQGKQQQFETALSIIETAIGELREQGVDQFVYMLENAKFYALAGQPEQAIDWLARSVERGLRTYAPLAVAQPCLDSLADNPDLIEIETMMIAKINEDRRTLGLEPIDPYATFWR